MDALERPLVAPLWHTVLFCALFLWLASASSITSASNAGPWVRSLAENRTAVYLVAFAIEWILLGLLWAGLFLKKTRLPDLIGRTWRDRRSAWYSAIWARGRGRVVVLGIESCILRPALPKGLPRWTGHPARSAGEALIVSPDD